MTLTGEALRAALRARAEITLVCHDEDLDPADSFERAEDIQWVRAQIRAGNPWGWFAAEVRAEFRGYVGRDTLGGCSYLDEADFRSGPYYGDMVTAAIDALAVEIESAEAQSVLIKTRAAEALAALESP